VEPLTRVQQKIVDRMSEAKAAIPDFFVEVEVDARALLALRTQLKEVQRSAPSINDFVVKAVALALRSHPLLNASYVDRAIEYHRQVNVGLAVAAEGSLLVPVVRDADRLSLTELSGQTRGLSGRARAGRATAEDLSGGTFTVSNLGMMGASSRSSTRRRRRSSASAPPCSGRSPAPTARWWQPSR
jgi:pyruvate dehydrogenase E2 component (dihydrolipoamide acetyltransferase)